jgi:hypothetical protein
LVAGTAGDALAIIYALARLTLVTQEIKEVAGGLLVMSNQSRVTQIASLATL